MSGRRIVVVGGLFNDIVVTPRGAVAPGGDVDASIRPRPGGSGANTAAWLGSLGEPVDFVGAVGSADAAEHERVLRTQGVEPYLQVEFGVPTGSIVIVVDGDEHTSYTERGATSLLAADELPPGLLDAARQIWLTGYSLIDGAGPGAVARLLAAAAEAGVPAALSAGSVECVEMVGRERFLADTAQAGLLLASIAEGAVLAGAEEPEAIVDALLAHYPAVVLTLGAEGSVGRLRGGPLVRVPAPTVRLVDPTGAGDAYAAGLLQHWGAHPDLETAMTAGAALGARAVMVVGGRPPV